jgi:hypothetical protein
MTQDVEKRWNEPRLLRQAAWYAGAVIALALLVMFGVVVWATVFGGESCADADFAVCTDPARQILTFGPVLILLLGGLGAFVRTYQVWKAGGRWPIWHGAGWVLLVLMVMYAGVSVGALAG